MATDQARVQPGAVEGDFVPNGLPAEDVLNPKDPAWPKLPGSQARNFVSAEPFLLQPGGLTLFRVWGEPAWDLGRFWSQSEPPDQPAFYGGYAVEYDWNSGRIVATLNSMGLVPGLRGWIGPTARQPAVLVDDGGRVTGLSPDHHLPGGETQVYVPDGTFPYFGETHTRWNLGEAVPAAVASPVLEALPREELPAALNPAEYAALVAALGRLAGLLGQLDAKVRASKRLAGMAGLLGGQANLLSGRGQALNAHLQQFGADPTAKARARATLWSLAAIGRHVDGDFSWSGQSPAIDQAVDRIVAAATRLAQRLA